MAEGHGRDAWARAALLCALYANAHRDPKKGRAFTPGDFDPYAQGREAVEIAQVGMETLKAAFMGRKG